MTFSDIAHECYIRLYDGISNYSDYCEVQKTETLQAMISLQKILFAFNQLNAGEELTKANIEGIRLTCEADYAKAICGMDFMDSQSDND
jgi:hypothetical protein